MNSYLELDLREETQQRIVFSGLGRNETVQFLVLEISDAVEIKVLRN